VREEKEVFRFGNGMTLQSRHRIRLPMMLCGQIPLLVWTSVVASPRLGLLLGKDFLRATGTSICFARSRGSFQRFDCPAVHGVTLETMAGGHYCIDLHLERFRIPTGETHCWTGYS
jgi:hypothetical protein